MKAPEKLQTLRKQMNEAVLEHPDLIDCALVALNARENVFLIGPPGTAKSMFCRLLSKAVSNGSYFELLMSQFTTPENLFGPASFSAMKQDREERVLAGYAAACEIVFLDEVWKANPPILNSTLALTNEHLYHNGGKPVAVPLKMLLSASNEYPPDESCQAIYDRFVVRVFVDYVKDRATLEKVLLGGVPEVTATLSNEDQAELIRMVNEMPFREREVRTLLDIKAATESAGFVASDRTWMAKASKLVRSFAVLNGHDRVESTDFLFLKNTLWNRHDERVKLAEIVGNAADPFGSRAEAIADAAKTALRNLPDFALLESGQMRRAEFIKRVADVNAQIATCRDRVEAVEKEEKNERTKAAAVVVEKAVSTVNELHSKVMFFREVVK
jgi:MoxR-like ATPase